MSVSSRKQGICLQKYGGGTKRTGARCGGQLANSPSPCAAGLTCCFMPKPKQSAPHLPRSVRQMWESTNPIRRVPTLGAYLLLRLGWDTPALQARYKNQAVKELGRIVRVDVDVLVGQVRGPENAGAIALVQLNADRELRLRHVGVRRGLVELRRASAVAADS